METCQVIRCQGQAFAHIKSFCTDQIGTINRFGALFRKIMNEFDQCGVEPTPDDILWVASEKLNRDIREC
jgi:hypothetical protein